MTSPENDKPEVIVLTEEINTYWKDADIQSRRQRTLPADLKELVWKGRMGAALRPNPDAEHCGLQASAATERGDRSTAALWIELAKLHALLDAR